MEFVPRRQPERTTTYRRPAVVVKSRDPILTNPTSTAPQSNAFDPAMIGTKANQDGKVIPNVDVGVYHDIIPKKHRNVSNVHPVQQVTTVQSDAPKVHNEVIHLEREPSARPIPQVLPVNELQQPKKSPRLLYAAAACIFLLGGSVVLQGFLTNQSAQTQVKALQSSSDDSSGGGLPTDEKPKDKNYVANHKVSPFLPRVITISSIGVSARVTQVGIDKEGAMLAPTTAYDAGWYTGSSRPGENGAMVIDGHVRGVGGPGVFSDLDSLKEGDEISIERGDGTKLEYGVVSTETVALSELDMGKLLVSANTALPGLNLITCAGTYDQKNDQFDKRTIVYAVQK